MPPMVPMPRPALPEDALTPGQMTGLQYSRDRYNDGSYIVGPDGQVTSYFGMTAEAPGGGYMNFPSFWDGKVQPWRDALARALQYEQQTGKMFSRYPTEEAADAGEKQVHDIMSQDSQALRQTPGFAAKMRAWAPLLNR